MSSIPSPALEVIRKRWAPGPDFTKDIDAWLGKHEQHLFLWSKQVQILESIRDNRNTAVQSCHSAGKSFDAATAAAWWIDSHPPGTARVVTSAPTGDQVKGVLWMEINRLHALLGLPGRTNQTEWWDGAWQAGIGRKPSDYDTTAFQGFHADFLLVVLDEACGMTEGFFDAASSLASNEDARVLAIGNPTDPQSHFAKVCGSETWHTIKISAFDTPAYTKEPVPERLLKNLISEAYVEEKRIEWSELSPLWSARVLGEFPTDAEDGIVPLSWANQCRYLNLPQDGDVELGFDVSGGGKDRSIVWARRGQVALKKWVKVGEKDPDKLASWVADIITSTSASCMKVDSAGLGWGVGALVGHHLPDDYWCDIVPVNVGEAADDSEHFLNLRAEVWWMAREYSRTHWWDLAALDDDDIDELCTPKYHTINPKQRIQVEKKDEVKKRIAGKSPDSADALILAFHTPTWDAEDLTDMVANYRM